MQSKVEKGTSSRTSSSLKSAAMAFICLLFPCLGSCASIPKEGDLAKAEHFRTEIGKLISQRTIAADAKRVYLQTDALSGWTITHVPITMELFAERPTTIKYVTGGDYIHTREVDWQCRYTMDVPAFIVGVGEKRSFDEKDLFKYGTGECVELVLAEKKITAYLSLFSLSTDLFTLTPDPRMLWFDPPAVTPPKEVVRTKMHEEALDFFELSHYKGYYNERTDKHSWASADVTITEFAGYHKESFSLIHVPVYELKRSNYYRIMLMGKHTITLLTMIGPTSASVEEIQTEALQILKALRYDSERP